jgi:hypothetical protein
LTALGLYDHEWFSISVGPYAIELAAAFALAISNIPAKNVSILTFSKPEDDRPKGNLTLTSQITWYGHGYCNDANSVRLSLAVILAYCTITVAYLIYILITGSTSTAWNAAIEIVALALQSRKPEYPGHMAVGIDSLDTFNQGVGIRVNGDNELELVFASDRDIETRGLNKIIKNKVY